MDDLNVCLGKQCAKANGVSVWEWSSSTLDEGDEASKWFSTYLRKPSRLVRFNAGRELNLMHPENTNSLVGAE